MQKYLSHIKDTDEKLLDTEIDILRSTGTSRMNKGKDTKIRETVRVEENQDLIYFKFDFFFNSHSGGWSQAGSTRHVGH
jgi:hypothetical protein